MAAAANRRHRSHWLTKKKTRASNLATAVKATARACLANLLLHSTSKDTYLHTATRTRAHIPTRIETRKIKERGEQNTQRILSSLCQSQSRLLLSCFSYSSLPARGCWLYSDRIHLMFSMCAGLTVFIGELQAHHAISSQSRLDRNLSADHLGEL